MASLDGVEQVRAVVPDRGMVGPPVGPERAGDLDDLLGLGEDGRVDQADAEAPGALRQRLGDQLSHAHALGGGRGAAGLPHGHGPDRVVAHERDDVDGGLRGLDGGEVLAHAAPLPLEAVEVEQRRRARVDVEHLVGHRGGRHAAEADDHGRHALSHRALGERIDDEGAV